MVVIGPVVLPALAGLAITRRVPGLHYSRKFRRNRFFPCLRAIRYFRDSLAPRRERTVGGAGIARCGAKNADRIDEILNKAGQEFCGHKPGPLLGAAPKAGPGRS